MREAAEPVVSAFRELRRNTQTLPKWLRALVWLLALGLAIVVVPFVLIIQSPMRRSLKIGTTVLVLAIIGFMTLASSLSRPAPGTASPPRSTTAATQIPVPAAQTSPTIGPLSLVPSVPGYSKERPIIGTKTAVVGYGGQWPIGVVDVSARVSLEADVPAASRRNDLEAFALAPGNLDLEGTLAQTGFHQGMTSYAIFFTYGRAAYQLETTFAIGSTAPQRAAAVSAANTFARSFYASLASSISAP